MRNEIDNQMNINQYASRLGYEMEIKFNENEFFGGNFKHFLDTLREHRSSHFLTDRTLSFDSKRIGFFNSPINSSIATNIH